MKNKSPGVGSYDIMKSYDALSPRSLGAFFTSDFRGEKTRHTKIPGPSDYKTTNLAIIFNKSPRAVIPKANRDPMEKFRYCRQMKEPGPASYDPSRSNSNDSTKMN